jgi:hypothetical protein
MKDEKPTDLRRHRTETDRNLLIGFFVTLIIAGGGLVLLFYGGWEAGTALACFIGAGALVGVVFLIMYGMGRLSEWLDNRDG